ncbi:hypothetical protein BcepSauron_069 [Burkholderia phage BcepSauron]|uniref:Uncharacterized protein n=1 Tax=Burkholderia phage BcepSauron TaxID=2530033 RepID=A0A482MLB9_9CAUD|nr:hypothetical protein H1O17_gp069 [Burkholderia phage BcepSauron]QBQ74449.1 hypothetical protein BcepSauron_069 [Burkholderia phage BcepSauron]
MLTKAELITAFKAGSLDEVAAECRRYGTITKDHSFDVAEGRYAGAHRVTGFSHYGINWEVRKHNGNVTSVKRDH